MSSVREERYREGVTKVRNTPELMEKFQKAFETTKTTLPGQVLSRAELRKLERMGLVEKLRTVQHTKYIGDTGAVKYVWRKK
jgi:hypothetical protein